MGGRLIGSARDLTSPANNIYIYLVGISSGRPSRLIRRYLQMGCGVAKANIDVAVTQQQGISRCGLRNEQRLFCLDGFVVERGTPLVAVELSIPRALIVL